MHHRMPNRIVSPGQPAEIGGAAILSPCRHLSSTLRKRKSGRQRTSTDRAADLAGVNSKARVVLTYANWEGFYNDCVRAYVRFLRDRLGKIRDTDRMSLII
jgi:hypothetical protein